MSDQRITSFSHIYLPVNDVDESIEFYTQNLGFKLLRKYRMSADGNPSAYVELGDVLLELTKSRTPLPRDPNQVESRIGLTVTDMDGVWADLMKKGVQSAREPFDARTFWGRQAQIKDPSGYGISLREWAEPDNPRFEGWQPRHEGAERLA
jgi:lactoylglutathione lyase